MFIKIIFCLLSTSLGLQIQSMESPLASLPTEIQQQIVLQLAVAHNTKQAVKDIKNFLISCQQLSSLLADSSFNRDLLQKLPKPCLCLYPDAGSILLEKVNLLNTPAARSWLQQHLDTSISLKEDLSSKLKEALNKRTLTSIQSLFDKKIVTPSKTCNVVGNKLQKCDWHVMRAESFIEECTKAGILEYLQTETDSGLSI